MSDFGDFLDRSVFVLHLPRPTSTGSVVRKSGGYRAVAFSQLDSDTLDGRGLVEPRRGVTVSCCLCPSVIRLLALGYGEMARRVEAARWHYAPGRHLHDRAWCPRCRPHAGKAVA
ncbi:hypothetical protein [Glycomyces salinus]|uniref:hypothetical protein n=1 Tax=Glycomyces salinus TaxID=980294 RepID=UPI0018EC5D68|nr:hypothetical protein [Glycomyces salinus]